MSKSRINVIADYVRKGYLVDISRNKIDPHRLQGVLLDFSSRLLLMSYIYDFRFDGFTIINIKDVSEVEFGAAAKFQQRILEKMGMNLKRKPRFSIDLSNWKSALQSVSSKRDTLILESEGPTFERFLIGKVISLPDNNVVFHHFDGTGKWNKGHSLLNYDAITRLQFDTTYDRAYSKGMSM